MSLPLKQKKTIQITETELVILNLVRQLQPYWKLDISKTQDGKTLTATMTKQERQTFDIHDLTML